MSTAIDNASTSGYEAEATRLDAELAALDESGRRAILASLIAKASFADEQRSLLDMQRRAQKKFALEQQREEEDRKSSDARLFGHGLFDSLRLQAPPESTACADCGGDLPTPRLQWFAIDPDDDVPPRRFKSNSIWCATCHDKNVSSIAARVKQRRSARIEESWIGRFAAVRASLPANITGKNFLTTPALMNAVPFKPAIQRVAEIPDLPKETPFAVLVGETGSLKTSLACALINSLITEVIVRETSYDIEKYTRTAAEVAEVNALCAIRFTMAPALARALSKFERDLSDAERALLEDARAAPLLVVDDLGHERANLESEPMAAFLLERHSGGHRTVITTGMDSATLIERYGAGVGRRLTSQRKIGDIPMAAVIECGPSKKRTRCGACNGAGCVACKFVGGVSVT